MRWKGLQRLKPRLQPGPSIEQYLQGFLPRAGASDGALRRLAESVPGRLPAAYFEFLRHSNGGEGFIGETYLRFYEAEKIPEVNEAYEVENYLPGFLLIASNTVGDAICFCPPLAEGRVVQVPFIPLRLDLAEPVGSSLTAFLARLAASRATGRSPSPSDINSDLIGKEVFQRHPIALGGSPIAPDNRVLVPAEVHPRLVRFWNKVYHHHLRQ